MRALAAPVLALAAGFAIATPASAQDFDLTMGVLPSPNSLYTAMMEQVPERIAKATDGKVQVTLNDSLVGGTQITAAVRDGRVPMSGALHTYLAGEDPRMGLFNLPGLVDNMAEYAYLCESFWCDDVAQLWEENWNSVVLAEGAWCSQALFSKEPIRTLEDFKGKKLRVHNPQTAALMEAIGAKPAPLPLSEVPPALERGVIDGVFTSTCYGNGQEYWRLAKNVQNWKIGPITGWVILINKDTWEEIPQDLRAAIRVEMDDLQHEALYDFYTYVNAAVDEMAENGVELWTAPASEIARVTAPEYSEAAYKAFYDRAAELGFDGEAYVAKARGVLGK
ncbi:TRAP transporter substrate-binding protein DctP [Acuticoccus sp. I52.16.1]|uniref:TRAP transporter substrate-binding protein DctP n=1 Tax=Acuticoccus sp. I52.16.1 TaxID=2928472 RepID=UPI001FD5969F|nr:TRAP transporter substrate-binding protein DctP [Acuticoccus sp. I52.16.1]UOM35003.1 TRAP transporter substrate-binding protein DctP [Acuticoccus sp. I52.16.1]